MERYRYRTIVSGEKDIEALVSEYGTMEVDALPTARPRMWAAHTRGIAAWFRREYPRARQELETALAQSGELVADRRPALWPVSYGLISVEGEFGYPLLLHEDTVVVGRRVGGEAAADDHRLSFELPRKWPEPLIRTPSTTMPLWPNVSPAIDVVMPQAFPCSSTTEIWTVPVESFSGSSGRGPIGSLDFNGTCKRRERVASSFSYRMRWASCSANGFERRSSSGTP